MPTAAILAGGRAARFGGRDKSALVIDGRSILERQITELLRVTDDVLLVDRRLKMSGLLEEMRVRELTAGEIDAFGDRHRLLANVNTPADYEEFGELLGH